MGVVRKVIAALCENYNIYNIVVGWILIEYIKMPDVTALKNEMEGKAKCRNGGEVKKNPLKNPGVLFRLNPYAKSQKRATMLDEERRIINKEMGKKRGLTKQEKRHLKESIEEKKEMREKREALKREKREAAKNRERVPKKIKVVKKKPAPVVVSEPEPESDEDEAPESVPEEKPSLSLPEVEPEEKTVVPVTVDDVVKSEETASEEDIVIEGGFKSEDIEQDMVIVTEETTVSEVDVAPSEPDDTSAEPEPVAVPAAAEPLQDVTLAAETEPEVTPAAEPEPEVAPVAEPEPAVASAVEPEPEVVPAAEQEVTPAAETEPEVAPAAEPEQEVALAVEPEPEITPAAEPEPEITSAVEPEPEITPAAEPEPEITPAAEPEPEITLAVEPEPEVTSSIESEVPCPDTPEISATEIESTETVSVPEITLAVSEPTQEVV